MKNYYIINLFDFPIFEIAIDVLSEFKIKWNIQKLQNFNSVIFFIILFVLESSNDCVDVIVVFTLMLILPMLIVTNTTPSQNFQTSVPVTTVRTSVNQNFLAFCVLYN
ncbi:hypothetical protein BpHYR1_008252 [Brachionus plicatilis]|uniref:Uncharacterized protein n=1 Tax=Brachionus plicatilis TaxID=10195 RepID=A0A3M7QNR2_BRAPC|nr:hypothetical protein BpHYR1_008252 [Brachionus plicatilis]